MWPKTQVWQHTITQVMHRNIGDRDNRKISYRLKWLFCTLKEVRAVVFPFGKWPAVRLLGHMEFYCLTLWGTSLLFSIVASSVYNPPNSAWGPPFSTSSAVLVISGLLGNSYLTGGRWYVIVVLIEFPRCLMMLIVFSCSCWPPVCLLSWVSVRVFCLVLNGLLFDTEVSVYFVY